MIRSHQAGSTNSDGEEAIWPTNLNFANLHSYDCQFNIEEAVYIKNFAGEKKWIAAKLYRPIGNVSYEVVLEDGLHVKRHLDHIKKRSDSYGAIYTI